MAHRTNAADARCDAGHLAQRTALAEFFETAKLHDVELGIRNFPRVVHVNTDFGVALNAGHGINHDAFCHKSSKFYVRTRQLRCLAGEQLGDKRFDSGRAGRTSRQVVIH